MPYVYEDKAGHLLEKYLSFIRTEDSFFFLHQVQSLCVWFFFFSVIIRAKMLYIIPDSGIQVNLVFSNQEPLDIAQEIMLLI